MEETQIGHTQRRSVRVIVVEDDPAIVIGSGYCQASRNSHTVRFPIAMAADFLPGIEVICKQMLAACRFPMSDDIASGIPVQFGVAVVGVPPKRRGGMPGQAAAGSLATFQLMIVGHRSSRSDLKTFPDYHGVQSVRSG